MDPTVLCELLQLMRDVNLCLMSTRKETNRYYPIDWDPSKGSLNTYMNSHPLRARAAHLNEGILVVRFEMPFNVFCTNHTCRKHISLGVRFNAKKKQVGTYLDEIPIYQFTMPCPHCHSEMIIRTDPAHNTYACIHGVQKRATGDVELSSSGAVASGSSNGIPEMDEITFLKLNLDKNDPLSRLALQEALKRKAEADEAHLRVLYGERVRQDSGLLHAYARAEIGLGAAGGLRREGPRGVGSIGAVVAGAGVNIGTDTSLASDVRMGTSMGAAVHERRRSRWEKEDIRNWAREDTRERGGEAAALKIEAGRESLLEPDRGWLDATVLQGGGEVMQMVERATSSSPSSTLAAAAATTIAETMSTAVVVAPALSQLPKLPSHLLIPSSKLSSRVPPSSQLSSSLQHGWSDDVSMLQTMRARNRVKRHKEEENRSNLKRQIREKGIGITLLPSTSEEETLARTIVSSRHRLQQQTHTTAATTFRSSSSSCSSSSSIRIQDVLPAALLPRKASVPITIHAHTHTHNGHAPNTFDTRDSSHASSPGSRVAAAAGGGGGGVVHSVEDEATMDRQEAGGGDRVTVKDEEPFIIMAVNSMQSRTSANNTVSAAYTGSGSNGGGASGVCGNSGDTGSNNGVDVRRSGMRSRPVRVVDGQVVRVALSATSAQPTTALSSTPVPILSPHATVARPEPTPAPLLPVAVSACSDGSGRHWKGMEDVERVGRHEEEQQSTSGDTGINSHCDKCTGSSTEHDITSTTTTIGATTPITSTTHTTATTTGTSNAHTNTTAVTLTALCGYESDTDQDG